ncbi:MAG: hypothetical protein Q9198_000090 [Flavoplaca austrocitrina]
MARRPRESDRPKGATTIQPKDPDLMNEDSSGAFDGFDSDEDQDKNSIELELEKAVFGDDFGFHERLQHHGIVKDGLAGSTAHRITVGDSTKGDTQDNLRDIADADVCSPATATQILPQRSSCSSSPSEADDADDSADEPEAVWHDSDDDRIVVSLQANPRLRKLRIYEDEDLVNGRQYTKRLRRQFELLNHVPLWVGQSRAKRKTDNDLDHNNNNNNTAFPDSDPDSSSEGAMSVDSDQLLAPPLAKLLQQPGALLSSETDTPRGKRKLRPEVIDMQRTKDVGVAQPSAITSLQFHTVQPLLISSGPASTVFMHRVAPQSPNPNPLLTSLHIHSTPLFTTVFQPPDGSKILFAGRRRYFHSWDLSTGRVDKISRLCGPRSEQKSMERFKISPCGRWMGLVGSRRKGGGLINVLDARTSQWIAEVHVESNGGVADFEWWGDGEGMTVIGKGGEAVEWDGRQRKVVGRWVDEGAVGTTVLAMGGRGGGAKAIGGDRWVAVGSTSGVVNVYDRKTWGTGKVLSGPKPCRAFDQLTTPISHLAFSPDGQLMVMASRWKRDALRLVHLPSCTVYKNWPTSSTPLGQITALAINPKSDLLAVANEQGKIRLWEIRA